MRALFLVNFLVCLGVGIADPFFSVYAASKGSTGFHLALMFSGYAAAKMLFCPITGWWSDRHGRRSLLLAGLGMYSAVSLCYLLAPGPGSLVLLRIFQGVCAALVRPVSLALVGDMAPDEQEGTVMGTFDISFYGAFAVGPVLGGFINDRAGFAGLFICLFCLCLAALFTAAAFVRCPAGKCPGAASQSIDFTLLRRSRMLAALCGFIFSRSFGIVLFAVFLPIFAHEELKLTGLETGIILAAATIVTALLLRPMGRLSDRMNRGRLVFIGGSAAALLTCSLPLASTFTDLLLMSAGIGMANVLSIPASSALLVEEGKRYGMGLTVGLFNGAMSLGAILAPLAGGFAFSHLGMKALFLSAGLMGVAGTIFYASYAFSPKPLSHRPSLHRTAPAKGNRFYVKRLSMPESGS